jgi:nicotinamidase-related amidase
MELADLIHPSHTAVVVSEMQRGIIGDLALPATRDLVNAVREADLPGRLSTLADGARRSGVTVVHATLQFRPRHVGVRINTPLLAVTLGHDPDYLQEGSPAAEIVPELAPQPEDVVHARRHGMSAFAGTDLDMVLRSLDVRTLVIGGVSLNEAVLGMAIEAVNLGYSVAVVRDAVAGLPVSFAQDMLRYAVALLGATPTVAEVLDAWKASGEG